MAAREFANDKRDDVYSPASGTLRLLPALLPEMRNKEHNGDEEAGEPVIA